MDGKDVVPDVWDVLDRIKDFTGETRARAFFSRHFVTTQPCRAVLDRLCARGAVVRLDCGAGALYRSAAAPPASSLWLGLASPATGSLALTCCGTAATAPASQTACAVARGWALLASL